MEGITDQSNDSTQSSEFIASLEALLFVAGSPIKINRLAKIVGQSEEAVRLALNALRDEYASGQRGIRISEIGDEVEILSAPRQAPFVEKLVKEEFPEELTPASLETLAIICYRSPMARAEIDFIRGVNSSYILRTLLIRGLISREPDPKHSYIWHYRPSFDLLKLLGVTSSTELPEFATLSKKLSDLMAEESQNHPPQ